MSDEIKVEEKTPEQLKQEDYTNRANAFIKEYGELVEKHKIDLATYPVFAPDGTGGFRVIIQNSPVDMTSRPVKSPFVPTSDDAKK